MLPQWVIEKKRDGVALSDAEIEFMVSGFTKGAIPDYQMAGFAMAIYFQGMSPSETSALTRAMTDSGTRVDTSAIARPKVDKHSTGGIGDKTSLLLAPAVAACGLVVPMISGRGLGITGGTLDKLESIPGFDVNLSEAEFLRIASGTGCAIVGQTETLAPADKKLYALRDVTGTVSSIPLIASSIMSKKLAAGLDALVLDVKCGSGAFMRELDEARRLAAAMVEIGRAAGTRMAALVTNMDQPLGTAAGNALEIRETVEVLRRESRADDLVRLVIELGARMLLLGGVEHSLPLARVALERVLWSGAAYEKFCAMVREQGGDLACIEDLARLPRATHTVEIPAPEAGWVKRADAELVGRACAVLGAGRAKSGDAVDPAVGVDGIKKIGARIERGEPFVLVHGRSLEKIEHAREFLGRAFEVSPEPVPEPTLVFDEIISDL